MVSNKESSISDCYVVRDSRLGWDVSFRRALRQSEQVQYGELLGILSNMFLCKSNKDSWIWKPFTSGEFSAKAFYLARQGNHYPKATSSLVWLGLVPPRVEGLVRWAFCEMQMHSLEDQSI